MTNALLPIRPNYVDAILAGSKKVEFRRTKFKQSVNFVLIYASSPVKKVVGYFKVGGILEMTPSEAWERYSSIGAINYNAFMDYYSGTNRAYVISIDEVVCFENQIALSEMSSDLSAPQSYRYLSNDLFEKAKRVSLIQ